MKNLRHTLMVVCFASAALSAWAQTPAEHNAHHPAGAAAPAPSMQTPSAQAPSGSPLPMGPGNMRAMDEHMKAMQAMHEKMAAAKTPEERQALMAEQDLDALVVRAPDNVLYLTTGDNYSAPATPTSSTPTCWQPAWTSFWMTAMNDPAPCLQTGS